MKFILISAEKIVQEIDFITGVYIPTSQWEIGVLPGHEPLISSITQGILRLQKGTLEEKFLIGKGVLETNGNEVTILADLIEWDEDLDSKADIAKRRQLLQEQINAYQHNYTLMDMESYLALEEQYLRESIREQIAQK